MVFDLHAVDMLYGMKHASLVCNVAAVHLMTFWLCGGFA